MTTTFSAFVTAIAGMTVSGVVRQYTAPPASIGDLPCSFPMLPSGAETVLTFGNAGIVGGQQPSVTFDLIFAFEAVGQGTQAQNYSGLLTLLDNVVTASKALTKPTNGPTTFSLRSGIVTVAGNDYWSIIETWSGIG